MNMFEAISSCFKNYFNFNGRARRSEYWFFYLFTLIVEIIIKCIYYTANNSVVSAIAIILLVGFAIPKLSVTVRRLHDIGKSALSLLCILIPLAGPIIILIFMVKDGDEGDNQYGPSPKLIL